eukprot:1161221-Pelagomonas_calceolata.AAC.6
MPKLNKSQGLGKCSTAHTAADASNVVPQKRLQASKPRCAVNHRRAENGKGGAVMKPSMPPNMKGQLSEASS